MTATSAIVAPRTGRRASRRAARRDVRVYASHPLSFLALRGLAPFRAVRIGRTTVVNAADLVAEVFTDLPLDRRAPGTIGGAISEDVDVRAYFNEEGAEHRDARRGLYSALGTASVNALRPTWLAVFDAAAARVAEGEVVDVVPVVEHAVGLTTVRLLGVDTPWPVLVDAARAAGDAGTAAHLRGIGRRDATRVDDSARTDAVRALHALMRPTGTGLLRELLDDGANEHEARGIGALVALTAITTSLTSLPRGLAWTADADLWSYAAAGGGARDALVGELIRVTTPTPLVLRIAAAPARFRGREVRAGDRFVLVTRTALRRDGAVADPACPAPAALTQLAFGVGPHSCPGALLARTQLADLLAAFAGSAPVVREARARRPAGLPAWGVLRVAAPAERSVPT